MTPFACTFCESRIVTAFSFGELMICRVCRDRTLTWLNHLGVAMSAENPFIEELCVGSHHMESEWYRYYDSIDKRLNVVIKAR